MTDSTIDARIVKRLNDGHSQREISRALGISRHQVRQVAREHRESQPSNVRALRDDISVTGLAGRISSDRNRGGALGWGGALTERSLTATATDAYGLNGAMLDVDAMRTMPLDKLIMVSAGISPEISRAHWDFLRMFVSGYEVTAHKVGEREQWEEAQAVLDQFRERLKWLHGDESVIYRMMGSSAYLRGAMIVELEMDERGREPVDIVTPDPALFTFRLIDGRWKLGQYQDSRWVEMDRPTFRHVQIDPRPGHPRGHAPIESALFPALFLLGLYQDLRRVIANQGYPRLDISVDTETLAEIIQTMDEGFDMEQFDSELQKLISIVEDKVGAIGPGDAYVHANVITMGAPIGAIGTELASIKEIIVGLERMVARALKTIDLDATAGADNSNRKYEQYIESVKSIQRPAEILLETIFEMVLQAYGFIADVTFRFATVRAAEAFRDARTRSLEIANELSLLNAGMRTPEEAATALTGYVSESVEAFYGKDAKTVTKPAANPAPAIDDEESGDDLPESDGTDDSERTRSQHRRVALPPVPVVVNVSDADAIDAANHFDDLESEYRGLLDATVEA